MFLKSIHLTNIRSYKDEKIRFPKGSSLLSGDIGSGKSTILLAIEFCLFGFRGKTLDGATLLRHGKTEGHIELKMDIDDKEVIIKRTLKKSKSAIGQSSGYIIKNGLKKELMPSEIRAEVIDMLGYPSNILTKSKDLIYRYTVYTPQEDMKRIILEQPETRLDVLRKVFNMDKYNCIKENITIYLKELKSRQKILFGKSQGADILKRQKESLKKEANALSFHIQEKTPIHQKISAELNLKRITIEKYEKDILQLTSSRREIAALNARLQALLEQRQRNIAEIQRLEKMIAEMQLETPEITNTLEGTETSENKEEQIRIAMQTINTDIIKTQNMIRETQQRHAECLAKSKNADEIKNKITSLDNCPTCEQAVKDEYKDSIISRENGRIKKFNEAALEYNNEMTTLDETINRSRSDIESMRKELTALDILKVKTRQIKSHIENHKRISKEKDQTKIEIGTINTKKMETQKTIDGFPDIESIYAQSKQEYINLQAEERNIAIQMSTIEKEKEGKINLIAHIDTQITQKEDATKKLTQARQLSEWLDGYFINLVSNIERHVMYSIYNEFDMLFREWASMLIDEENLTVKLDDRFTPVITQNGYDASIENLSGGEKTAIALSYRLALNKVINDLITGIKTSDIIILDEPTDGFSATQLDKVRDVLDQLDNRQIIIVSHEPKIESFVESVIHITKDEHVSQIM